jgi:mannose-6-phosphate isomerase-like protein (cupin superfamily)
MGYALTKSTTISRISKFEINLEIYPSIGNCGVVIAETDTGHNEEFYHVKSAFNYIVLDGAGSFFLDDHEVKVAKGDYLSIEPGTRIYYRGKMRLILVTTPPWEEENEVETKAKIW